MTGTAATAKSYEAVEKNFAVIELNLRKEEYSHESLVSGVMFVKRKEYVTIAQNKSWLIAFANGFKLTLKPC